MSHFVNTWYRMFPCKVAWQTFPYLKAKVQIWTVRVSHHNYPFPYVYLKIISLFLILLNTNPKSFLIFPYNFFKLRLESAAFKIVHYSVFVAISLKISKKNNTGKYSDTIVSLVFPTFSHFIPRYFKTAKCQLRLSKTVVRKPRVNYPYVRVFQNGTYACASLCPQEYISPQGSCRHPRLVEVPGQCCREWMCDSAGELLVYYVGRYC